MECAWELDTRTPGIIIIRLVATINFLHAANGTGTNTPGDLELLWLITIPIIIILLCVIIILLYGGIKKEVRSGEFALSHSEEDKTNDREDLKEAESNIENSFLISKEVVGHVVHRDTAIVTSAVVTSAVNTSRGKVWIL